MIRYVMESLKDVQYDIFIFFIHVLKKITPERTIYIQNWITFRLLFIAIYLYFFFIFYSLKI